MIITVTLNPALDRTLTVPEISFGELIRAGSTRLDLGGKGFNVSRALKSLGTHSRVMGFAGGATGRLLDQGLNQAGIETDFTWVAGETRTNTVIIEAGGRYIKVNEPGPQITSGELSNFLEQAAQKLFPEDLWVLSGSLPPGVPPDFYATLIQLIRAQNAWAFLDASGEALQHGCTARPYLVKPNASEASQATGIEVSSLDSARLAADRFLKQGIQLVALSLGADGLLLASQEGSVIACSPALEIQNPVGAGDALLAGILYAIESGSGLDEIARWGVAAGTAAALHPGVEPGTYREVETLYDLVRIVS